MIEYDGGVGGSLYCMNTAEFVHVLAYVLWKSDIEKHQSRELATQVSS